MKKALTPEFLDEVLKHKYADINQRKANKGKNVADEGAEASTVVVADEEVYEQDVEEATRRSLIENYTTKGESSKAPTIDVENEEVEEELVDYGSTLEHPTTPFDSATEVLRKMEEENVLSVLSQHLEGTELPIQ